MEFNLGLFIGDFSGSYTSIAEQAKEKSPNNEKICEKLSALAQKISQYKETEQCSKSIASLKESFTQSKVTAEGVVSQLTQIFQTATKAANVSRENFVEAFHKAISLNDQSTLKFLTQNDFFGTMSVEEMQKCNLLFPNSTKKEYHLTSREAWNQRTPLIFAAFSTCSAASREKVANALAPTLFDSIAKENVTTEELEKVFRSDLFESLSSTIKNEQIARLDVKILRSFLPKTKPYFKIYNHIVYARFNDLLLDAIVSKDAASVNELLKHPCFEEDQKENAIVVTRRNRGNRNFVQNTKEKLVDPTVERLQQDLDALDPAIAMDMAAVLLKSEKFTSHKCLVDVLAKKITRPYIQEVFQAIDAKNFKRVKELLDSHVFAKGMETTFLMQEALFEHARLRPTVDEPKTLNIQNKLAAFYSHPNVYSKDAYFYIKALNIALAFSEQLPDLSLMDWSPYMIYNTLKDLVRGVNPMSWSNFPAQHCKPGMKDKLIDALFNHPMFVLLYSEDIFSLFNILLSTPAYKHYTSNCLRHTAFLSPSIREDNNGRTVGVEEFLKGLNEAQFNTITRDFKMFEVMANHPALPIGDELIPDESRVLHTKLCWIRLARKHDFNFGKVDKLMKTDIHSTRDKCWDIKLEISARSFEENDLSAIRHIMTLISVDKTPDLLKHFNKQFIHFLDVHSKILSETELEQLYQLYIPIVKLLPADASSYKKDWGTKLPKFAALLSHHRSALELRQTTEERDIPYPLSLVEESLTSLEKQVLNPTVFNDSSVKNVFVMDVCKDFYFLLTHIRYTLSKKDAVSAEELSAAKRLNALYNNIVTLRPLIKFFSESEWENIELNLNAINSLIGK